MSFHPAYSWYTKYVDKEWAVYYSIIYKRYYLCQNGKIVDENNNPPPYKDWVMSLLEAVQTN